MGAIVPSREKQNQLRTLFSKAQTSIAAVLPQHLTAERLLKIVLGATSRTPELLECTGESILLAVMQAAQLGLEPNTPLGLAYLIPYRNKKGQYEAQFVPGYKGLLRLAVQSGEIKSIQARVVHARDRFEIEYGLEEKLVHKPWTPMGAAGDDTEGAGALVAVYAVAELVSGGRQFEVMWKRDVDAIRSRSRAGGSGPWVTDYEQMAIKTVVRRLCKNLPLSTDMMGRALEHHARAEQGDPPDFSDVAEALGQATSASELPAGEGRAETLERRLAEGAARADGATAT